MVIHVCNPSHLEGRGRTGRFKVQGQPEGRKDQLQQHFETPSQVGGAETNGGW
jgi:hypothetical protein